MQASISFFHYFMYDLSVLKSPDTTTTHQGLGEKNTTGAVTHKSQKRGTIMIITDNLILALLVSFFEVLSSYRGNGPSLCPVPEALQSEFVRTGYAEQNHQGFFYEIGHKDATQPHACKCTTSNKTLSGDRLQDDFYIQCYNKVYYANLSFVIDNERPGYMTGTWNNFPLLRDVAFPNTIVDVGVNPETGEYEWIIEFQCKQAKILWYQWVSFYGINFYSRRYDDPNQVDEMARRARERGLGPFLDSGSNLYVVDHTGCLQDH